MSDDDKGVIKMLGIVALFLTVGFSVSLVAATWPF